MDESSERLTSSPSALSVEYRGQNHKIPIARDKKELKQLIQERVLPSLKRIEKLNSEVDLAITEYVYIKDESIEADEEKLANMLKDPQIDKDSVKHLARISRKEGLNPILSDRISWRKNFPNSPVDDTSLPFARRTFLIAPMVVNKEVFEKTEGPSLEEDTAASNLFIGNAVAFDGEILLEKSGQEYKIVTNKDLLQLISPLLK